MHYGMTKVWSVTPWAFLDVIDPWNWMLSPSMWPTNSSQSAAHMAGVAKYATLSFVVGEEYESTCQEVTAISSAASVRFNLTLAPHCHQTGSVTPHCVPATYDIALRKRSAGSVPPGHVQLDPPNPFEIYTQYSGGQRYTWFDRGRANPAPALHVSEWYNFSFTSQCEGVDALGYTGATTELIFVFPFESGEMPISRGDPSFTVTTLERCLQSSHDGAPACLGTAWPGPGGAVSLYPYDRTINEGSYDLVFKIRRETPSHASPTLVAAIIGSTVSVCFLGVLVFRYLSKNKQAPLIGKTIEVVEASGAKTVTVNEQRA